MYALKLANPVLFLSTLSLRRATPLCYAGDCTATYFYPRSPCGERQSSGWGIPNWESISIHALLAESDPAEELQQHQQRYFYPRSPCGERPTLIRAVCLYGEISIHALLAESDSMLIISMLALLTFLSTLSLRRATVGYETSFPFEAISIHALLAESDGKSCHILL